MYVEVENEREREGERERNEMKSRRTLLHKRGRNFELEKKSSLSHNEESCEEIVCFDSA